MHSAGLGELGAPPPPEVVDAALEYGVDLSAHRSRRLAAEDIANATLVVGLERQHVREAVLLSDGAAWGRAFTLRELVRRGLVAGPRPRHQALEEWLAALHQGRAPQDLLGTSAVDDVADPMGGTSADLRTSAATIAALTEQLAGLVWRARPRRPSQPRVSLASGPVVSGAPWAPAVAGRSSALPSGEPDSSGGAAVIE